MMMQEPMDLFSTKGIEYLLAIGFLATLIVFWRLMNASRRQQLLPARAAPGSGSSSGWFQLRPERFYHQGHSWALPEDDGTVTVGIDDFGQKLIGGPSSVALPSLGKRVRQGAPAASFTVDQKAIDLLSPIEGEVVATNDELLASPELVNKDPYGSGWLMRIKPKRIADNLKNLLSARLAKAWLDETERVLREKMSGDVGVVLQDGGVAVEGIARSISESEWDLVAKEFLLNG